MGQLNKRGTRSTPAGVELEQATAEAIRLRGQGWTYQRIGDHQGVNVKTAWDRVQNGLRGHVDAEAANLRGIENIRLEAGMKAMFDVLTDPHTTTVQRLNAVDRIIRLSERISRLNGLDVPVRPAGLGGPGESAAFDIRVVSPDGRLLSIG